MSLKSNHITSIHLTQLFAEYMLCICTIPTATEADQLWFNLVHNAFSQ